MIDSIKPLTRLTSLTSLMVVASWAIASAASAAAIDFGTSPWSNVGNVSTPTTGQATLNTTPNAYDNGFGDLDSFVGLDPNDYALNTPAGSLDPADTAYEGSAFKTSVNAGDTLSFNWDFTLFGTDKDYAFTVYNGVKTDLATATGTGSFSQTFSQPGNFSFGVVDVGDYVGNSPLLISSADYGNATPIPTPALLPGLIGMGVAAWRKRKAA